MDNYPTYARMIYQAVALSSVAIIAGLIGSRLKTMHDFNFRAFGVYHILIFSIYGVGIIFAVSTNLLLVGATLQESNLCLAGAYLCLACYVIEKSLVYLFFLHRVHTCRTNDAGFNICYKKDWVAIGVLIWIVACVVLCTTFAFLYPIAIHGQNGKCTIGLPTTVTIALIAVDLHVNVFLVLFTIYFTSKLLGKGSGLSLNLLLHALPFRNPAPLTDALVGTPPFYTRTKEGMYRLCVAKAIWGTIGIILPTAANLGVLLRVKGHEDWWLCMSCCVGDVLWSVIVVHWMTNSTGTTGGMQPLN
ncbi:MAG: hypothetical protein Q9218_001203 [Villophora microphyllina]